jgi:CDP-4-dehydro-6-deoxyglucose reductase, E3
MSAPNDAKSDAPNTPPAGGDAPAPPKPPGRVVYKMRVDGIRDHTHRIRELYLTCAEPTEFTFRSGQFVMLHVPGQEKPTLRAYSIASSDLIKGGFRLIFNHIEGGLASTFIWTLKGGETLNFTGPFGRLFFKEPPTEQIVMLNTGSGISQHICYIESNILKYPSLRYRMLTGMRTENDVYYTDVLDNYKNGLRDFDYAYVLSRPTSAWTGKKGYVQHFLKEFNYLEIPTTFYLCGNGAMIKDVKTELIGQGFDGNKILAEAFD